MEGEQSLKRFFQRYASTSLGPEPERLAELYDEGFLVAGPSGGAAFQNDESFSYILRLAEDGPRVAGYVSHEDQEEVMRARGLL